MSRGRFAAFGVLAATLALAGCNLGGILGSQPSVQTKALPPSEVSIGPISADSASGVSAVGSSATTSRVAGSDARVAHRILTEFNAKATAEGILINIPENVLFDFDKADLRPDGQKAVGKLASLVKHYSDSPVEIRGYTDSKGTESYNQALSDKRANAVKTYLTGALGVPAEHLTAKGLGEKNPVAPDTVNGKDSPANRQKNRRVEVIIKTQDKSALSAQP